jgi:hypothetical protein
MIAHGQWRRRGAVAAITTALFAGALSAASAAAPLDATPAWEVQVVAQPSVFSAADSGPCEESPAAGLSERRPCDGYMILARNSGAAPSTGPVTITDSLPSEGVTPLHIAGIELQRGAFGPANMECAEPPLTLTVTCTYPEPVPPDGVLVAQVNVVTSGGAGEAADTASVEGGGAATVTATAKNRLDGTPVPFGVASYGMSVARVSGGEDGRAGSHPYELTTHIDYASRIDFQPGGLGDVPIEEPRDIVAYLPPGVVGNPQALEQCSEASFLESPHETGCPKGSVVGSVTADLRGAFISSDVVSSSTSSIYNLTPDPGFPAEFGFTLLGQPVLMYGTTVWHNGRYSVRVSTTTLPPEPLLGVTLTFFGDPSEKSRNGPPGQAFLRNPTACTGEPLQSQLETDSSEQPHRWTSVEATAYTSITECDRLQFNPTVTVIPDTTAADSPAGYSVTLAAPQPNFAGLTATPDLKNATITLPAGTALNPAGANGLVACQEAGAEGIDLPRGTAHPDEAGEGEEIGPDGLSRLAAGHCPAASQIGDVEVATPLLREPLQGHLFVAAPQCGGAAQPACDESRAANGELFRVYLEAAGSGVVIKLAGDAQVNPQSGQLTIDFTGNPQLPFESVRVKLLGGARAPLANPQACGPAVTSALLEPWGGPASATSSEFQVTGCLTTTPFKPGFSAGTVTPLAGAYSAFMTSISRQDGEQNLSALIVQTPPGLLGMLSRAQLCPEPQASSGTCGPASLIGHTQVAAGAGSHPFWVGGDVFLTGPYKGAPFGLSVVVPAIAGPFNLGDVIVRAAIFVDPHDSHLTVISSPLPQIIDGVPLRLQTINVTIDKPGFMFNPTNCSQLQIGATITAAQGASANVTSPFAAAACKNLPFKPGFTVSTSAKTSKANGASLYVKVTQKPGEANIQKVDLQLPLALPSRLTTLQKACSEVQFATNPAGCPAGSVIGTATAHTPVLQVPLTGPAYLVSHGGAAFPDVEFVLQADERGGDVEIVLDGKTQIKKGVTYSHFETVPDAPISSFETDLPEGPHSVLSAYGNLCAQSLVMPTTLVGQNGAEVKQSTKVAVTGCKAITIAKRKLSGRSVVLSFYLTAKGTVNVSGKGLNRYRETLTAGSHQISVGLSKAGLSMRRHHARIKIKVALKSGTKTSSTTTTLRL